MLKRILMVGLLIPLCTGVSCQISIPDDDDDNSGGSPGYVQLDRATAELDIKAALPATTADVVMSIRRNGRDVELQNGQQVTINDLPLLGPRSDGLYYRTVPRAAAYVVRVTDPTLGSNDATLLAPADFAITAPTAGQSVSLANGFTLTWSNPTAGHTTVATLSQTLATPAVKTLGPIADDAGSVVVAPADLINFRQGADIALKLTKTASIAAIGGFAQASGRLELSQSISVVPAP